MSVLGVDIGTTGCKVIALRSDGTQLARASREYPLIAPQPHWVELDPAVVWRAVASAIRECTSVVGQPPGAIALSAPGEAFVPVDSRGRPTGHAIVSFDARARPLFEPLNAEVGLELLRDTTGLEPLPHYALYKLRWWREARPEVYQATERFVTLGGFVALQLGAEPAIDPSLAIRVLAYDRRAATWSDPVVRRAGLDVDRLPPISEPGTPIGCVASRQALKLGLQPGAVVGLGTLDQVCAALGTGVTEPGQAMLSLGTTAVLAGVTHQSASRLVPVVPHVVRPLLLGLAGSPAGGAVLRWYRDVLGQADRAAARTAGKDVLEMLTSGVADRRTALVFHAHLGGSRMAFDDPGARGAIHGLTFGSDRADIVRALLEGVAYELALLRRRFERAAYDLRAVRAAGGGSKSVTWMQVIADTLEVTVESTQSPDAAARGAALLALVASGHLESIEAARDLRLPVLATLMPRPEWLAYHREGLARYVELYHPWPDGSHLASVRAGV